MIEALSQLEQGAARRPDPALPSAERQEVHRIAATLELLAKHLHCTRRVLHAGDVLYHAGKPFGQLHVVTAGMFKLVQLAADGREQLVGVKFRGDWLGLDGMADGKKACDAVALDTSEVWTIGYRALLEAAADEPALLGALHAAMGREIYGEREWLMSVCSLPTEARVADFLLWWAQTQEARGLRGDQICLRLSRAEIGNYLGMTLESVSRGLSRLRREHVIAFIGKGRHDLHIPDVAALSAFVQRRVATDLH
ncbi:MAG: Crp/Fnr family transcriptional regulator [Paucibacter sp.]|nr:Crp/Fnr family transcriptional regulator [Roseateles sp.]